MSKDQPWPDRRQSVARPAHDLEAATLPERRNGADRRRSRRVGMSLDTAVPVQLRTDDIVQWGMARNISEGGMLIEVREPPTIGSEVEVRIPGIQGSSDAPTPAVLRGEVRHHVAWNFADEDKRTSLCAIGVRFLPPIEEVEPRPGGWLH